MKKLLIALCAVLCLGAEAQATVSMMLDSSDVREVSKTHFWFYQVAPQGIVLALTGTEDGVFGDQRTAAPSTCRTIPKIRPSIPTAAGRSTSNPTVSITCWATGFTTSIKPAPKP